MNFSSGQPQYGFASQLQSRKSSAKSRTRSRVVSSSFERPSPVKSRSRVAPANAPFGMFVSSCEASCRWFFT
jgi:hypothetical protein